MTRTVLLLLTMILAAPFAQSDSTFDSQKSILFTIKKNLTITSYYAVSGLDTLITKDTVTNLDTLFPNTVIAEIPEDSLFQNELPTVPIVLPNYSAKVTNTLKSMTLEEKAGQMIIVYHSNYRFLSKHKVGAVLIMQNMLKKPAKLVKNLKYTQENMHIPLLVTIDQEGGKINRLKKLPGWGKLPSATTIGQWDSLKVARYALKVGKKLKSIGVNTNLAPVLDPSIDQFGVGTFMQKTRRSFGTNSDSIFTNSTAFMKGMKQAGILCVTKHYPGYDVEENSDHAITVSKAAPEFIEENIQLFNRTMGEASGVMINSIHYPSLCTKPAVFCPELIQKVRDIDFDKLIITDDLWGASLRAYVSNVERVHQTRYPKKDLKTLIEMSFIAGNDMLMTTYPKTVPTMIKTIVELAKSDPKYLIQLNNSVRRILIAKDEIGLLENVSLEEWRAKYNQKIQNEQEKTMRKAKEFSSDKEPLVFIDN